jgi:hypothetical protein
MLPKKRIGGEEQQAADHHEDSAERDPGDEPRPDFRYRDARKRDAEESQIPQEQQTYEDAETENMDRVNDWINVGGLTDTGAERRVREPLTEREHCRHICRA